MRPMAMSTGGRPVDEYLSIRWPVALAWSPDARLIAVQTTGITGGDVIVADEGGDQHVVASLPVNTSHYVAAGPDQTDLRWIGLDRIAFNASNTYWAVSTTGNEAPAVLAWPGVGTELATLSPNGRWLAYVRDGDIWIDQTEGGRPRQITHDESYFTIDSRLFARLYARPTWAPDSSSLAYLARFDRGLKVVISAPDGKEVGRIVPPSDTWTWTALEWAPDASALAISRLRDDQRVNELLVHRVSLGNQESLWVDRDEAYVSHFVNASFGVSWSRSGERLALLASRDGWQHAYVLDVGSGRVLQRTRGAFEVDSCAMSPDGTRLAFVGNRDHRQSQLPYLLDVASGVSTPMATEPGSAIDARTPAARPRLLTWTPSGDRIAFGFSTATAPFSVQVVTPPESRTVLPVWRSPEAIEQRPVEVRADDGTLLHALLLWPSGSASPDPRAALVHVYGAWGQSAAMGWGLRDKAAVFNFLVASGIAVLVVDPRGSDGYGRAYAMGQVRDGGGKQADDVAAAARYLSAQQGIDPASIAVFGHSYGAYLSLEAVARSVGTFAAAVVQAGPYDWSEWASSPFAELRFGPHAHSDDMAAQRSPLRHLEAINIPLLIVHGTADLNVPLSTSQALVRGLMRKGQEFEYLAYPDEGHSWLRPETQRDFMLRIRRFLHRHLPAANAGSALLE